MKIFARMAIGVIMPKGSNIFEDCWRTSRLVISCWRVLKVALLVRLVQLFRLVNTSYNLRDKFVKRSELHSRQTRNNNQLDIPLFRTASGQRTFYYRAVKIWNSLENELREIQSLSLFKRKLKICLLHGQSSSKGTWLISTLRTTLI
jgi:hypothetical protein